MPSIDLGSDSSSDSSSDSGSSGSSSRSNSDQWEAAMRGASLPDSLACETARCAVIRGIRCHYEFATGDAVEEACTIYSDIYPELARARNARLIMSNQIPEPHQLQDPNHVPYCIWYPDFAQEKTYREVARRHPNLRYQVGRACAAAGYVSLYQELDLLPDVSIAEEARESSADGSRQIFNIIMASPTRYAVMNDLHRSLYPYTKTPAFLNGDTAVHWMLEARSYPSDALPLYPDIEEDRGMGEEKIELPHWRYQYTYEEAKLLFTPLPPDLPTFKKDLLIQMAAYEGNFDRYARLMRPGYMTIEELHCVVRGIFHNTMFARWWAEQLKVNQERIRIRAGTSEPIWMINHAINARRVMVNDISGLNNDSPYLPYMIWWPLKPTTYTLENLAEQCPKMKHQIAIACVFCDYESTYRDLQVMPHYHIWLAAKQSPNPFYLQDLETRAAEQGFDVTKRTYYWSGETSEWLGKDLEPTSNVIYSPLTPFFMSDSGQAEGTYFEYSMSSDIIERYVWQRPDLLYKLEVICEGYCPGSIDWIEDEELPEDKPSREAGTGTGDTA